MAENKKSFILYADLIHTVEKLPDDKAGELFKHILRYVNDQNPVTPDLLIEVTFEPIKQQLKRDLKKWVGYIEKQRENGSLGGRPKKPKPFDENPLQPKKADNVSVNVNDNVTVTDSVLHSLDHCSFIALRDQTWVMNSKATESELKIFNKFLLGSGVNEKNFADYKKHFYNWKRKNPQELIGIQTTTLVL